jgi:hypothetical protein
MSQDRHTIDLATAVDLTSRWRSTGGGGALMVVQRALASRGEMLADPGFLVGSGFLLIGTPSAFLAISKWHFPISDREIRVFAYTLKNILSIGASGLFVATFRHARRATLRRVRSVVP